MKRVASLYLPNLSIDRLRRTRARSGGSHDAAPLILVHHVRQRVEIAAACSLGQSLGLHPGMAVTQARALIPGLQVQEAEPHADAAFLKRLALFAHRWTPRTAVSDAAGLWLDLSGVSHLFGGERALCERILRFCVKACLSARVAVAGTAGAAHALARYGKEEIILCPNGREIEAISNLPVAALRLEEQARHLSGRFGIETIADLIAIPRGPLARRFGQSTLLRLDQALGRTGEAMDPIIEEKVPQVEFRLVEPIVTPEAIEQVLKDLLCRLAAKLECKGLGATQFILSTERVDGSAQELIAGTSRTTRDAGHLLRLMKMRIEELEPGFGIEAMRLSASRCESLEAEQLGGHGPEKNEHELALLVDRLAGRIGERHVFRWSAVESDVPERSIRRIPPLDKPENWPLQWPRPIRLLARPERVEKVMAELPDQPPIRFSWRGEMHIVRKADGPERIHGEWWKRSGEAAAVRDYFQVEDESGARFWLFRRGDGVDPQTGDLSWYVHGLFA
jgi:protein ImuB